MTDKVFHFVRHHEVADYERLGWVRHNGLDDTHHGVWSSLMEWKSDGEPVKPFFISCETSSVSNRVPEIQTENANDREHRR